MKRRGILLVNPRICSPEAVRLPLSLLALGAVLEGRWPYRILDGNLLDARLLHGRHENSLEARVLSLLADGTWNAVGLTVMPGPQVATSIALSRAVRAAHPEVTIVWGGYFPTLYPDAALNAPYVDAIVRGQGEEALLELLERLDGGGPRDLEGIDGLSFRDGSGATVHAPERRPRPPGSYPPLPYERLEEIDRYFRPTFLGRRTGVYQAAVGCRYHCSFCGVVSMWNGRTHLGPAERLAAELEAQRDRFGATAMQLFDHNFFDREETSLPLLDALAHVGLPWWCYARADTLAEFSASTWEEIRRSRLRMAYIGAEAASDEVLRQMRKGSRVEHTFEVAARCRENGVIPEFSFVLGGPEDPEGEVENTFQLIRRLKTIHPECEVILYFYTPTPRRSKTQGGALVTPSHDGLEELPTTPQEWTEKRWIDFVCHRDASWLTPRLRRRVEEFACVLGCRFPTVQDVRLPRWGRRALRTMAAWRWAGRFYDRPWELRWARRRLRLRAPQDESL